MTGEREDRRFARGNLRRRQLIAAALRVVERSGPGAVTHRAVALEAGVGATAATYYYRTVDELLVAVLVAGAERFTAELGERLQRSRSLSEVGEAFASSLRDQRGMAVAEYELYLLAARRKELRPVARRWIEVATDVLGTWSDDPVAVRGAVAACDGLLLQGLIADAPPTAEEIAELLGRTLDA